MANQAALPIAGCGAMAEVESIMQLDESQNEAFLALVTELRDRSGTDALYVFWSQAAGAASSSGAERKPRTLLAFPSADAALAFAQRNQMSPAGNPPRLRRLSMLQLLQVVLREPSIAALLIAAAEDEPPPAGRLPAGILLAREAVLARIQGP